MSQLTIRGATNFTGNTATDRGGALALSQASTGIIIDAIFTDNRITGTRRLGGTNDALPQCLLTGSIPQTPSAVISQDFAGGAVHAADEVSLTLERATFQRNTALFGGHARTHAHTHARTHFLLQALCSRPCRLSLCSTAPSRMGMPAQAAVLPPCPVSGQ